MDVAIIGLPQSGRTTVFNALTRGHGAPAGGGGPYAGMLVGAVRVPDPRPGVLAQMYQRKQVVYPEIKYWDLPGPDTPARSGAFGGKHRNVLLAADAYLLVVRAFTDPGVHHPSGGVDPGRDLRDLLSELALSDLEVLERGVERLQDGIKKSNVAERPSLVRRLETIQKVKQGIEEGLHLRRQELAPSEAGLVADYQLLTCKPAIVAINTDEAVAGPVLDQLGLAPGEIAGLGQVSLCAKLEADLAMMPAAEEKEFRRELGLADPASFRIIQVSYETLGLVSFLTIGDDEVRAWSVRAGLPAQEAAGVVHTDFYRGFIRAEVIPYGDLVRCGSLAQGRKEGVLRTEGKSYPVKDGDVINFLVNV